MHRVVSSQHRLGALRLYTAAVPCAVELATWIIVIGLYSNESKSISTWAACLQVGGMSSVKHADNYLSQVESTATTEFHNLLT